MSLIRHGARLEVLVDQMDLLVTNREPATKPLSDSPARLELLITVKAAPQPSSAHGGTVCGAVPGGARLQGCGDVDGAPCVHRVRLFP